uniref:Uncharacterized protein n=1 Tax=Magallana gigas TaxID=29159 RepID=K1Q501_MAGGI
MLHILFKYFCQVVYKEIETRTPLPPGNDIDAPTAALFTPQSKYNMPCTLWIWDVQKLKLSAVITQGTAIKCVFNVHSLKWHPDGNTILLLGKDQMCVCYLSDLGAENTLPR